MPCVFCHRTMHLGAHNHAATDNQAGGRLQARYLREQGASSPAFVTNREDPFSHRLREQGFAEIFPAADILNVGDRQQAGEELARSVANDSIDGIAFVNDLLLVQTVAALSRVAVPIDERFPIVGYDNSTVLMALPRRPATIEIGIPDIYRSAAEALIELIDGERTAISLVHRPTLVPAEA